MFKNLNEKDKKKIYSLISLGAICIISLVLIPFLPGGDKKSLKKEEANTQNEKQVTKEDERNIVESKLKKILSQIEGAGDIDVMVTFESSEEIQPAFNSNSTTEKTEEKDPQGGVRTITTSSDNKTMVTSNSSNPVIIKTTEAKVKGVIVVSSGASNPQVKETLYSAVQTSLQISGHQVEIYSK
ncbi:stage III sporulation protein AG [Romboutsia maritimum]|uniref:Stage III sporulation protein AG n=1 Tax=Romboutsia maritimum TaxID=2020948 RepID=A0A371IWK7_9FIRM|nr:stage III sporulation protein AG [Romboutsia maritimum]RDY24848.1 stage III sporulation protein AG [Romboutsia maritimum]